MKGAINYVGGVTVSFLVLMKIPKGQSTTLVVVDCPFDIFIKTSKFIVTPPT
jgi:hypothetical protein